MPSPYSSFPTFSSLRTVSTGHHALPISFDDHCRRLPVAAGSTATVRQRRRPNLHFPSRPSFLPPYRAPPPSLHCSWSAASLATPGRASPPPPRRRLPSLVVVGTCPTGIYVRGRPKDTALIGSPGVSSATLLGRHRPPIVAAGQASPGLGRLPSSDSPTWEPSQAPPGVLLFLTEPPPSRPFTVSDRTPETTSPFLAGLP